MPFNRKFIIEGENLIIANCEFHHQLVNEKKYVNGGGWWKLDRETSTFTLYGESFDFGAASIEDIALCISKGNVFSNKYCINNISKDYSFKYDTGTEILNLNKTKWITLPK